MENEKQNTNSKKQKIYVAGVTTISLILASICVIMLVFEITKNDSTQELTWGDRLLGSNQSKRYFFINTSVNFSDLHQTMIENGFSEFYTSNEYFGVGIWCDSPLGNYFCFSIILEETDSLYPTSHVNFSCTNLTLYARTWNYDLSKTQEQVNDELGLEINYFKLLFPNLSSHMIEKDGFSVGY